MLTAHLEDRFREKLGDAADAYPPDQVRFAVEFTRLLSRIAPEDVDEAALGAMRDSVRARVDLAEDALDQLLKLVLSPENRAVIGEDELRAFGARFGQAEESALRAAVRNWGRRMSFSSR